MAQTKRIVVFDLGGVLIDWNPRYLYRKLFGGNDEAMEEFLREIRFSEWNAELDRGISFPNAIAGLCAQFPGHAPLIHAYRQRWEETLGEPIQSVVDLLPRLKRSGCILYALTNFAAETFPIARKRFSFLNEFEAILVSGEVGIAKPDPRIYSMLLARIGRGAPECLFIDDRRENILVAESLGFPCIWMEKPDRLEKTLHQRGYLDE